MKRPPLESTDLSLQASSTPLQLRSPPLSGVVTVGAYRETMQKIFFTYLSFDRFLLKELNVKVL